MIGILDYGVGNIASFLNSFRLLNIPAKRVAKDSDFCEVQKLILPGVGHFDDAVDRFRSSEIYSRSMIEISEKKLHVLGICVGMQILGHLSDEGELPGLGLIDSKVLKFDIGPNADEDLVLPHMGWNSIMFVPGLKLFDQISSSNNRFYFLHSYYFSPTNEDSVLALTNYGIQFCCVVNKENVFGCQFHPEKSHADGLLFLKNFAYL